MKEKSADPKSLSNKLIWVGIVENFKDISDRKLAEENLRKAHDELEYRVKERTAELAEVNEKLKREIAERKQAQDVLNKEREQLISIFDSIDEIIYVSDPKTYELLYANGATKAMFGQDVVGKKCYRVFQDLDKPCDFCTNPIIFGDDIGKPYIWEFQNKINKRWYRCIDKAIKWPDGRMARCEMAIDIHERKQAEEALQESEEKHRTFLEANHEPVVVYDMEGKVVYFNAAFTHIFGWTLEECLGKKMDVFVPEEALSETNMMINKMLAGEPVSVFKTSRYNKEGNIIPVNISGALYRDKDGNPVGSIINLRDISEQKKLEAQLRQAQKMDAVGTLAGGIAHDFNNILQCIIGYTEILLEKKDRSNTDYESLQVIEQSSLKAADLIGQLLIFSRKVESELKPVVLNNQIIEVSKLLERTFPKMISIEYNLAQDLKIINADPLQIEQVLMNLGVNAKDAMPDGGRLILETENITLDEQYCKTHPGAGPGEYVLSSVTDTGHGMDKETLEHIFEPFYTTKEVGEGTGLGLAMIYGIVKSHGGYIMCYSEIGLGTTFKIYFPVLNIESPEQIADSRVEPRAEALPGGRETILLVDDDAAVLKLGKAMLERRGYTTIMAESGERAIEIYEKEKELVDLVILDVGMPGIGGHKCLEHLLKIDPGIKVVIATGYAPIGKVKDTLESGAAGFIAKPFLKADMLKRVREVLDKKL